MSDQKRGQGTQGDREYLLLASELSTRKMYKDSVSPSVPCVPADDGERRRRPGNQVRHDECHCGHWRSSHQGWTGCINCECATFRLKRKDDPDGLEPAEVPVKVQCANPQPTLAGPCGWTGTRTGRLITTYRGRTFREDPTHKRCPRCGGPVKQAVP